MKRFYLHVGAPKTATSFFQTQVFNCIPGVRDNDKEHVCRKYDLLRDYGHKLKFIDPAAQSISVLKSELEDVVSGIAQDKILISEESYIGYWGIGFANAGNIAFLLREIFPEARILLTVREQYSWLCSLYQYCYHQYGAVDAKQFFITDPEEPVWALYRRRPSHVHCWVNWYFHYKIFCNYFGKEQVFLLPYEWLLTNPERAEDTLTSFLEQEVDIKKNLATVVNKSNKLSLFSSKQMEDEFIALVQNLNRQHNNLLDKELPHLELASLGYYL